MSVASEDSRLASKSNDPLYQVKLLAALRSGDPSLILPLITDISKGSRASVDSQAELGTAALHLAIRCASCDTIQLLLQQRSISPNAVYPSESGTTPLHLAASIGRADVVSLLLEQGEIDDTIRDSKGLTCKEVARSREIARLIQDSRTLLNASFLSHLRTYILSAPTASAPDGLITLLQSPRIRKVDINQLDAASGTTLLHESAKRKDLRLVELAIRAGADVFVRDRRGRGVVDSAGKDDRVKAYLRQFTNQNTTLLETQTSQTEEPSMKGYLTKYGNLAKGYNTRWFVLKNGMFSYYRHQEDENLACRGSLSMRNARIKTSSTDKLRFEVHASTRNGEGTPEKWYMKANHAVEVARWVQTLQRAIDWSKRMAKATDSDTASIASRRSETGTTHPAPSTSSARKHLSASSAVFSNLKRRATGKDFSPAPSINHEPIPDTIPSPQEDGSSDDEGISKTWSSEEHPPHQDSFELLGNTAATQIDLTVQLLSGFDSAKGDPTKLEDIYSGTKASLSQVQILFNEYMKMVTEREAWFKAKVTREHERAGIWEESLHKVVEEGEQLEEELRKSIKFTKDLRRQSKAIHEIDLSPSTKQRSTRTLSVGPLAEGYTVSALSPVSEREPTSAASTEFSTKTASSVTKPASPPGYIAMPSPQAKLIAPIPSSGMEDSDEEDEFFDAIEANNLPNLVITEPLKSPLPMSNQTDWIDMTKFEGYKHLRERLPLDADNRPPVSLWAVLKGSIGKDLTKISFPVFFNEPTSMLQRMAEDMEFSECLDAAVSEQDPLMRIAYVAAFAMSNYSSTIGRIAKPFNPMLGETFEYVRLDRGYTYVSEQVSHHPPISACWADSPRWHYYGEVDAKNKFAGKSFEIRPTGVAHADLKLPKEWAPSYPGAGDRNPGKVIEHYSWKKVITNVSGFILGSPTIDHYGEMTVVNHRTREKCILTFKPRGWKAKDSFEIKGQVIDSRGEVQYDIAGRWNNQLVARKVGNHPTDLLPDVSVGENPTPEYILLWRNTEKPRAPFNLTPFAMTLNDCPKDTLLPYLPPTDCRLRPDQRAFETGMYERANQLKMDQEEFQRATRRRRETGEIPSHRPRWFEAKVERDTGERYWAPIMAGDRLEYWAQRERVHTSVKSGEPPVEWTGVERIFIEANL